MAIAFDAAERETYAATTSATHSHTGTGSNLAAFVFVLGNQVNNNITGCTYDGVAMTEVGSEAPGVGTDRYAKIYYLSNVPSGAKNVVASASTSDIVQIYAGTWSGVATGAADATVTSSNQSATTSPSIAVTTVADNCWVAVMFTANGGGTFSNGTNYTARVAIAGSARSMGDSGAGKTPAGSITVTATNSNSEAYNANAVSMAPFVASAATTHLPYLGLLGVGQ